MIYQDENLVFITPKVVVPSLKNLNNGLKFLIINFVPSFYKNHIFREKNLQMLFTKFGL